jgi:hypothetical protein
MVESESLKKEFPSWFKKFSRKALKLFAGADAEGPVSAIRVFNEARADFGVRGMDLTTEIIWRSVEKFLVALGLPRVVS